MTPGRARSRDDRPVEPIRRPPLRLYDIVEARTGREMPDIPDVEFVRPRED